MTTPAPIETVGLYFLGINHIHHVALAENERRESAARRVAEAEDEAALRHALMYEWTLRQEIQGVIDFEDYIEAGVSARQEGETP